MRMKGGEFHRLQDHVLGEHRRLPVLRRKIELKESGKCLSGVAITLRPPTQGLPLTFDLLQIPAGPGQDRIPVPGPHVAGM